MITGIARIFQKETKSRERSDRAGEWCGTTVRIFYFILRINFFLPHTKMEGVGPCTPYSYASDS